MVLTVETRCLDSEQSIIYICLNGYDVSVGGVAVWCDVGAKKKLFSIVLYDVDMYQQSFGDISDG